MRGTCDRSARKISSSDEHIIDDVLIRASVHLNSAIHAVVPAGWNARVPNLITLASLAAGLHAAAGVARGHRGWGAALWMFAYFLDCADGAYARRYDAVSRYGDYLDHGCDLFKWVAMTGALVVAHGGVGDYVQSHVPGLAVVGALLAACAVHVGCQQREYIRTRTGPSETLDVARMLCSDRLSVATTRHAGPGLVMVVVALLVYHGAL